MSVNIIITMAGNSRRFREMGYSQPKYEIVAHGRTLFEWSMLSLANFWSAGAHAIFVTRREFNALNFIRDHVALCGIKTFDVVELDDVTAGQAETALMAETSIKDVDRPLLIYNIDTFVHPSSLKPDAVRGQGWIPCFHGLGDGWSFAQTDENGRVSEVREKIRISDWATIGLYYFASFSLYKDIFQKHFAQGRGRERGELYIAPMYNTLLSEGGDTWIGEIPFHAVVPLGTPAELDAFKQSAAPQL